MATVLAAGTFDVLHKGHEFFLREAKKKGTALIVVVARDQSVEKFKGKKPLYGEDARTEAVRKLGIASKVLLGHKGGIYDILEEIKPDIICLGYDQRIDESTLATELKKRNLNAKIERLGSFDPHIYKSSKFKPESIS